MALREKSALVVSLSCLPTSEQENCIIHFRTILPCSTKVDVLETGDVPILFSLSQMKNLGTTVELDPKRGVCIPLQLRVTNLVTRRDM